MSNPDVLLSVIIPTFNRHHFLLQALRSLDIQTCKAFVVIVVDDGSTDSSPSVTSYPWNFDLIYITQVNSERGAARNNGIFHSLTDYVYFMDSDDMLMSNHIECFVKYIIDNDYPGIIAANYVMRDVTGKTVFKSNHKHLFTGLDLLTGNPLACNFAFNKRFISTLFSESRTVTTAEDWLFLLESCFLYKHVIYVAQDATVVMSSHDNRSMTAGGSVGSARLAAAEMAISYLSLNIFQRRILLAHSHYIAAVHFYLGKSFRISLQNIYKALSFWASPYILMRSAILFLKLLFLALRRYSSHLLSSSFH